MTLLSLARRQASPIMLFRYRSIRTQQVLRTRSIRSRSEVTRTLRVYLPMLKDKTETKTYQVGKTRKLQREIRLASSRYLQHLSCSKRSKALTESYLILLIRQQDHSRLRSNHQQHWIELKRQSSSTNKGKS